MATNKKISKTVPLSWDEVYFTNCPMVSANNIDQELGWCKTDFKHMGIDYNYFRSRRETNWYPHYIHNLDLSPHGIIDHLNLREPVYSNTAAYGHFGRSEFAWENVDATEELLASARNE